MVLTTGRVIEADEAWFEGTELRYRRSGIVYAVPRGLVARIGATGDPASFEDPDVRRSRERLAAGDGAEALRYARLALFRDPSSVAALQALAAAQVARGDGERARESAARALSLEPGNPLSLELLGDALMEVGDFIGARERYRLALDAQAPARVRKKLDALGTSIPSVSSARFRILYDGAADEPLGLAVMRMLDAAWEEYERRLGFAPGLPVTVVLQTATTFRDTTRAPGWAAAWNDGTIRVPVMGLDRPTPGLVRVLRHELAHSFVATRAGARCPTWLHEGLAQWLEGGDPEREDPALARRARLAPLPRLESLEQPFVGLSEADAAAAYAESLSAVAHLLRLRGESGVRRLIDVLGQGLPAAEALPTAYAMSYGELQKDWEAHLMRVAAAKSPTPQSSGSDRGRSSGSGAARPSSGSGRLQPAGSSEAPPAPPSPTQPAEPSDARPLGPSANQPAGPARGIVGKVRGAGL